jgi:uncharacterized RDD family membrane protein YckC
MRASLLLRVVARSIDLVIVLAAVEALSHVGWLAAFVYILIGDSLMDGSTLGKKLTGLRVFGAPVADVESSDSETASDSEPASEDEAVDEDENLEVEFVQHKCTPRESILRNAPFAVGMVLWRFIPYLGWMLMVGVIALEFLVLLGSPNGKRIGDELAQTSVVLIDETKED